jgi:hypothetical protein
MRASATSCGGLDSGQARDTGILAEMLTMQLTAPLAYGGEERTQHGDQPSR